MKINVIGMILNNAGRHSFDAAVLDDNGRPMPAADSLHAMIMEYAKVFNGGTSDLVTLSREVLAKPEEQQPAVAQGTGEVGHIAENLAAMIVEWVGDRPDLSENWKPGLAHIIKLRLERLIRTPPPAQPAPVVPEGWKLVPIKCTEAMKDVGGQFEFATIADGRLLAQSMWNELLLATQPPPAQQDQPTDQNFPEAATRYFYDWCDQHGQGWSVRPIDMFAVGVNWARRYATQPAQAHWTEREPVRLALSRVGRVYIAGPMTGIEEFNFPAFNAEADKLRGEGLAVLNPAEHGIVDGAEWADYLRHDIAGLASCERIHLLRGWSKSKGAQLEVTIAKGLGMAITYQEGAVQASAAIAASGRKS